MKPELVWDLLTIRKPWNGQGLLIFDFVVERPPIPPLNQRTPSDTKEILLYFSIILFFLNVNFFSTWEYCASFYVNFNVSRIASLLTTFCVRTHFIGTLRDSIC